MALEESVDYVAQYEALTRDVGVADYSERTQIELAGADRTTFLHNFCTADIRRLKAGHGVEAFITDAKGGILAFVYVFCTPDTLVLETVPGQAEKIIGHLDRYLIREKVTLTDRSTDWAEVLLAGPRAANLLTSLGVQSVPAQLFEHSQLVLFGTTVWLRRVDIAGADSFLLSFARGAFESILVGLEQQGARRCQRETVEAVRIEAGTPFYGPDIHDRSLPQELNRDTRAISFTKGCYLGQETVARIDALGHVNKTLVQLQFAGADSLPAPGTELRVGDAVVGQVTSAALSPRRNAVVALAYVRRGHNTPGTQLDSSLGTASII